MKKVNPRRGSLQFWPRKRAKNETARVRSWADEKDAKLIGFAGYKVGMTHLNYIDNTPNSLTKGQEVSTAVTVIECPPLKGFSAKFYKKTGEGVKLVTEVVTDKVTKEVSRRISAPKQTKNIADVKAEDYDFIRLEVYTQPKETGFGKKKPEFFEVAIGGKKDDQLAYVTEKLGQDISVAEVFGEGNQIDIHAVTKGKGFQGAVKRFGVKIRESKSEKGVRTAGSLGPWCGQGHIMYRVPAPGKMGYHLRTEYNKWILKISDNPEEINPKGGFINFGNVKTTYVLVKGSVAGPKKRLIRFNKAIRPRKNIPGQAPSIEYISLESKQ